MGLFKSHSKSHKEDHRDSVSVDSTPRDLYANGQRVEDVDSVLNEPSRVIEVVQVPDKDVSAEIVDQKVEDQSVRQVQAGVANLQLDASLNKKVDEAVRVAEADVNVVERVDEGAEQVEQSTLQTVIKETTNLHNEVEVQPVVDKIVEETEIQQIVQPVLDKQRVHTQEERENEAQIKEIREEKDLEAEARYQEQVLAVGESYVQENEATTETRINQPVVREVHRKHVIQEIQPVIEREIDHVHVVKVKQPVVEHVTAATKVAQVKVKEAISMQDYKDYVATNVASESIAAKVIEHPEIVSERVVEEGTTRTIAVSEPERELEPVAAV